MNLRRRDRTSMRGRLALLVFGLVAGPMLLAGSLGYSHLRRSMRELDDKLAEDAANLLVLRATHAASFLGHGLEDSLRDLEERASLLDGVGTDSAPEAFGDLPLAQRPTAVAEYRPSGSCRPPLPQATVDALRPFLQSARSQSGYVLVPPLPDGAGSPVLHQVVLQAREGSRMLIVLRRLDGPSAAALIASLPAIGEGTCAIVRPTESGGLDELPIGGRLWSRALEQGVGRNGRAVGDIDLESGTVAAASLLTDPAGRPVALAAVSLRDPGPSPLARRYGALFASVVMGLGLMAVVGLLASILLGLLAPRWVWGQLREATEFIFQSVERLRELVRRNSRALDEQSDVIQRVTQSVAALRSDSQVIAETARGLAHTASQSAKVTQSGNEQAEQAKDSVRDLREKIGELSLQTEDLERRCKEIGAILAFLNHLNNETNTLSVNATIQAAGSGIAGSRQLSVMAGEIGKLADLTRDSMLDIQAINERIQDSSRTTLVATQEGRKEVESCLRCCAELESSFRRILKWVEETTQSAHGIEGSTARQSQSLETVSTAIEALERRSRETVGNFQDVVMAAEELAELGTAMNRTWKVG